MNVHDDFDVGARLRMLRIRCGLSQRELARRAGVTNGMVSLIEQNRVSPSVASLRKILQGVPIPLAEFFALDSPPQEQVFYRSAQLIELTKGKISFRQVGDVRGRTLQMLHEKYEPGADTGRAMLQHEAEEGGVVVRGELELTVGNQKQILKAGDAYLFDSRQPHRFRNVGTEVCEVVSGCTPPFL